MVGPKVPGTTNRGRKKTISLEQNALLGSNAAQHNANGRGGGGDGGGGGGGRGSTAAANDSSADGVGSAKRSRLVSAGTMLRPF